jgi:hypothetical protein
LSGRVGLGRCLGPSRPRRQLCRLPARLSGGKSRKAWEDERRARIAGKKSITVKLSDIQIAANGDKATARFRQDYAADALKGRWTMAHHFFEGVIG